MTVAFMIVGLVFGYFLVGTVVAGLGIRLGFMGRYDFDTRIFVFCFWPAFVVVTLIVVLFYSLFILSSQGFKGFR